MSDGLHAVGTGVPGLDELLYGGFVPGRMYLVRGEPGTGKTLLGMQYLRAGLESDETVLFIHGEESRGDIVANGVELGIDLSDAEFLDLGPDSAFFAEGHSYDLVDPSDVETNQFIDDIRDAIEDIDPSRVCIDPITQLRYVESNDYRFRKRLISLMRFLKDRGTTVLATRTDYAGDPKEDDIASLSDGIIELSRDGTGRRISVPKHRGVGQRDGSHGMAIREGGIEIYPSLLPGEHGREFDVDVVSTGVDELDSLLGGGIERGTATFVTGPTGIGKTTLGTHFLVQSAREGDNPVTYLFEESRETFEYRSNAFGLPVTELEDEGRLTVEAIEPLTMSAEEFGRRVRDQVAELGTEFVMIDGIRGYQAALHNEQEQVDEKLHALVRYLTNMGVTVLLVDEIRDLTGLPAPTSANVSYVADNIVFLSYLELGGGLRRVAGMLKKRVGDFDHEFREFRLTEDGLEVGGPVENLHGILQGSAEVSEVDHEELMGW